MIEQIYNYFTVEILYYWVNLGVLPFWIILIFFPNTQLSKFFVTKMIFFSSRQAGLTYSIHSYS